MPVPAVRPRADLESLPGYLAGRTSPGTIKLADNEVPFGPLPSVARAIATAAAELNRYPDVGAGALTDRLAGRLGLPADRIAVGCGSVSLCQQVVQALCQPGDEVMCAWRSFEAYPIIARIAGATIVRIPLDAGHTHDLDAMLSAVTPRTKLVFVCNPNNPTGTVVHHDRLERFLDLLPAHVLVAIDEAYREFVTDPRVPDGLSFVRTRDNVAVLRTFSKAYGLAGLRVGYLTGPASVITAARKVQVPFSVNSLAQAAAQACLDAEAELLTRCAPITAERERVRAELRRLGYHVPPSQTNFVWLPLANRATKFANHARAGNISVRAFPADGVRVTIGTPEQNGAFLHVARTFSPHSRGERRQAVVGRRQEFRLSAQPGESKVRPPEI